MITKIYANYGVLAHEKRTVYTTAPASDIYDELIVEIPDDTKPYLNNFDEVVVELEGNTYLLSEVLCGDEFPHLMTPREHGVKYTMLRVLEYPNA